MTTLQRYKPIPELKELNVGYEAGWDFDVIILQAEPDDKIGSIIIHDSTRDDEKGASTLARIVSISPTAFKTQDWENTGLPPPYAVGDVVYTKRYPAGVFLVGADGRTYMAVKDKEIGGKRVDAAWAQKTVAAA